MGPNWNDGHNPKIQIPIEPNIGLDGDTRRALVALLNRILADESVLAAKTRSAYWNVCGVGFFEHHTLLGTQYRLLNKIVDEIAERACMLGGFAIGSLGEFLRHTRLEEQPGDIPTALHLLADHETVIRLLREDGRKCSEEYEDAGTSALLVSVMRRNEKIAWMLRSYLESEPLGNRKTG